MKVLVHAVPPRARSPVASLNPSRVKLASLAESGQARYYGLVSSGSAAAALGLSVPAEDFQTVITVRISFQARDADGSSGGLRTADKMIIQKNTR